MQKFFEDQIVRRWHTLLGGVAAAAVLAIPVVVATAKLDVQKVPGSAWAAGLVVFMAAMLLWWLTNRRPRAKRNRIGVLVALRCNDDEHGRRIRHQFIGQVRRLLEDHRADHQLELVEYRGHRAERISTRTVGKAMAKSRCQFAVFGTATLGKCGGEPTHVLNVQGMVRVGSIHPIVRRNLQTEFEAVMPRRLEIGERDEIPLFEGHSESIECAARYMLGLAALASGNLNYAENLLRDLYERANAASAPKHAALRRIRGGRQLAAVYEARTRLAVTAYRSSHNVEDLLLAESRAAETRQYHPTNVNALLALAFAAFELRRDVKTARELLRPLTMQGDPAPTYSNAFLLCYEGKLCTGWAAYRKAFKVRGVSRELPQQCKEHIRRTLSLEPERFGLHFALTLINYHALGDLKAAGESARAFTAAPAALKYRKEVEFAQGVMAECAQLNASKRSERSIAVDPAPDRPVPVKAPENALRVFPPTVKTKSA